MELALLVLKTTHISFPGAVERPYLSLCTWPLIPEQIGILYRGHW